MGGIYLGITIDKLQRAGFSLEKCEDGKFWVYKRIPGETSARLLATCRLCISDFEEYSFSDAFIPQCDFDFKNPVLYLDGFLWRLSPRDFASLVQRLKG